MSRSLFRIDCFKLVGCQLPRVMRMSDDTNAVNISPSKTNMTNSIGWSLNHPAQLQDVSVGARMYDDPLLRNEKDTRFHAFAGVTGCAEFLDNRVEQDEFEKDWRALTDSETGCPQIEMYRRGVLRKLFPQMTEQELTYVAKMYSREAVGRLLLPPIQGSTNGSLEIASLRRARSVQTFFNRSSKPANTNKSIRRLCNTGYRLIAV